MIRFKQTTNRSFELRRQLINMFEKCFTTEVPKTENTSALTAAWVAEFLNRHKMKPGDVLLVHNVQNHVVPITPFDNTYHLVYLADKKLE